MSTFVEIDGITYEVFDVMTPDDRGDNFNFDDDKLDLNISQDPTNDIQVKPDGIYIYQVHSMQHQDMVNYLSKTQMLQDEYFTTDWYDTDREEIQRRSSYGNMLHEMINYYDKDSLDNIIESLPEGISIQGLELVNGTLRITMKSIDQYHNETYNVDVFEVPLTHKIPRVQNNLLGTGTEDDPFTLDIQGLYDGTGFESQQHLNKEDFTYIEDYDQTYQPQIELSSMIELFDGRTVGFLHRDLSLGRPRRIIFNDNPLQDNGVTYSQADGIQGNMFYTEEGLDFYVVRDNQEMVRVQNLFKGQVGEDVQLSITDALGTTKSIPLNQVVTSNVTSFQQLFKSQVNFNQVISSWDTSNVTTMLEMFYGQSSFNQNIESWDVSNVENMKNIFRATTFNKSLNGWDVSSVTDMHQVFYENPQFNQPLDKWDVSNVQVMRQMFANALNASIVVFNQDISMWDTSSVINMSALFRGNRHFDQDISNWNVSNATNMEQMFHNQTAFNQDLSNWCVLHIRSIPTNFYTDTTAWEPKLNRTPIWGTGFACDILGTSEIIEDIMSFEYNNMSLRPQPLNPENVVFTQQSNIGSFGFTNDSITQEEIEHLGSIGLEYLEFKDVPTRSTGRTAHTYEGLELNKNYYLRFHQNGSGRLIRFGFAPYQLPNTSSLATFLSSGHGIGMGSYDGYYKQLITRSHYYNKGTTFNVAYTNSKIQAILNLEKNLFICWPQNISFEDFYHHHLLGKPKGSY